MPDAAARYPRPGKASGSGRGLRPASTGSVVRWRDPTRRRAGHGCHAPQIPRPAGASVPRSDARQHDSAVPGRRPRGLGLRIDLPRAMDQLRLLAARRWHGFHRHHLAAGLDRTDPRPA